MPRLPWIAAALVQIVPTLAAAGAPIHPDVPWARTPDDDWPLATPTPTREQHVWEGDMLRTDAPAPDAIPAMAYEPTVGILYLAMEGVTISPDCSNGEIANGALNCSPLVSSETNFPAYGNGSAQAALYQELLDYYDAFNIVVTVNRPPEYLPYTMAVVGGSASQAGLGGGVCGVANVQCDGLKRNHVSLTFPDSCGGVAETAAQETSHNWGLEHVDDPTDLMYPFNNGGFKAFLDACNAVDHSTGSGTTQCGYIHEIYCPSGGGEQQNSYQELLGVFGPREVDTIAPEIVEIHPTDGTTFTTADSINITARITEDSNFIGAKWTWLEGLPDEIDEYTRCTNNVCTADYPLGTDFDPNAVNWDLVNLTDTPPGTYSFKFEVLDAYGNGDAKTITFEVIEGGPSDTGIVDDGGSGGGDGTGGGDSASGGPDDGTGGEAGSAGEGATSIGQSGDDGAGDRGCACGVERAAGRLAPLVGLVALARRRRRASVRGPATARR